MVLLGDDVALMKMPGYFNSFVCHQFKTLTELHCNFTSQKVFTVEIDVMLINEDSYYERNAIVLRRLLKNNVSIGAVQMAVCTSSM
jgi:hypothetical protein